MNELKFKKFKLAILIIVSTFDIIMFGFGLFLIIYNYDIYTVVFGAILVGIAVIIGISDIFLLKAWKYRKISSNNDYSKNPEILKLESEIEEIKRKNNIN